MAGFASVESGDFDYISWQSASIHSFESGNRQTTNINLQILTLMEGARQNAQTRLEILTALTLFDAGSVSDKRIRESRQLGFRLNQDHADAAKLTDIRKIQAWYRVFMPEGIKETAGKVTGYLRFASLAIGILAFLTGSGAAGYLFYYDGTAPVNVLPVLTLFAFLPLVLLLFSVGFSLIGSRRSGQLPMVFRWIEGPVRSRLRRAAEQTSDGSEEQISGGVAEDGEETQSGLRSNVTEIWLVHSEPVRYFLKQNLQLAGAAYLTGALLWMLFNIITTDLAFSWSSTLEVRGEKLYSITQTISAPWARLVPSAVPDRDTVEATRYYRADRSDIQAASSGRWWPFIFMTILVYGFLPKALAFAWFRWRFSKTTDQAILSSDSGSQIIGYMDDSLIVTEGDEGNNATVYAKPSSGSPADPTGNCGVLFWGLSDTDTAGIQNVLNRRVLYARHFGGMNTTEQDRNILMECARLSLQNNHCDILVLVPFEESPTIRLEKKLHFLLGESRQSRIIIVPVIEESDKKRQADEINWRSRVDQINEAHGRKRVYLDVRNILDINRLT